MFSLKLELQDDHPTSMMSLSQGNRFVPKFQSKLKTCKGDITVPDTKLFDFVRTSTHCIEDRVSLSESRDFQEACKFAIADTSSHKFKTTVNIDTSQPVIGHVSILPDVKDSGIIEIPSHAFISGVTLVSDFETQAVVHLPSVYSSDVILTLRDTNNSNQVQTTIISDVETNPLNLQHQVKTDVLRLVELTAMDEPTRNELQLSTNDVVLKGFLTSFENTRVVSEVIDGNSGVDICPDNYGEMVIGLKRGLCDLVNDEECSRENLECYRETKECSRGNDKVNNSLSDGVKLQDGDQVKINIEKKLLEIVPVEII